MSSTTTFKTACVLRSGCAGNTADGSLPTSTTRSLTLGDDSPAAAQDQWRTKRLIRGDQEAAARPSADAGGGTRTPDTRIMIPPTFGSVEPKALEMAHGWRMNPMVGTQRRGQVRTRARHYELRTVESGIRTRGGFTTESSSLDEDSETCTAIRLPSQDLGRVERPVDRVTTPWTQSTC
jgi:hypothetical protein